MMQASQQFEVFAAHAFFATIAGMAVQGKLRIGQPAVLRFSAFNMRTTPELNGTVAVVSADITQDQRSGASYYTMRLAVSPDELARLDGLKLVAGMPVEVFVQTSPRTIVSYVVRPFHDQIVKAFRER